MDCQSQLEVAKKRTSPSMIRRAFGRTACCAARNRLDLGAVGAAAGGAWAGLIDGQVASFEGSVVERFDGGVAAFLHLDESETTALAGFSIGRDFRARDLSELGAHRRQFVRRGGEPDIADEQLLHETSSAAEPQAANRRALRPEKNRRERRRERIRRTSLRPEAAPKDRSRARSRSDGSEQQRLEGSQERRQSSSSQVEFKIHLMRKYTRSVRSTRG